MLAPIMSTPWSHSCDYVPLHDKRDFANAIKVINQLTSK